MKAEKERSEKSLAELRAERESELEALQEERDRETEVGSHQSFAGNYSLGTLESLKESMAKPDTVLVPRYPDMAQNRVAFQVLKKLQLNAIKLATFLKSSHILVFFHSFHCWPLSLSNKIVSVAQEVRSKQSLVNFFFLVLFFSPQVFQSQITALQDEMEEKGQEMDKLQLELKDKEVENRIAGKKGDQLVSVCLFVSCCFLFNLTIIVCLFAFPLNLFSCCCCCCCCCFWVSFYFVFLLLVLSFCLFVCLFCFVFSSCFLFV